MQKQNYLTKLKSSFNYIIILHRIILHRNYADSKTAYTKLIIVFIRIRIVIQKQNHYAESESHDKIKIIGYRIGIMIQN